MEEPTLSLSELLAEAAAAAGLGDRVEAERLYRRATNRSPGNSQAWLGLAAAVESMDEKRSCYEKALVINPSSAEAKVALQRMAAQGTSEQATEIQAALATAATSAAALAVSASPSSADANGAGTTAASATEVVYCVNHPETETALRCNRCNRPVCVKCVKLTDVGYRCKDCIREQQDVFFSAQTRDYFVVAIVSFVLAAIAAPVIEALLGMVPFFGIILAIVLGPVVGGIAATIIRRSVGRRRGRYMGLVAVVAILLGTAIGALVASPFLGINFILLAVFLFTALSTIYATLR